MHEILRDETVRRASSIELVTQDALIESILDPYRGALGPSLYAGYRSHAYRMVNFARALRLSGTARHARNAASAIRLSTPCLVPTNGPR